MDKTALWVLIDVRLEFKARNSDIKDQAIN